MTGRYRQGQPHFSALRRAGLWVLKNTSSRNLSCAWCAVVCTWVSQGFLDHCPPKLHLHSSWGLVPAPLGHTMGFETINSSRNGYSSSTKLRSFKIWAFRFWVSRRNSPQLLPPKNSGGSSFLKSEKAGWELSCESEWLCLAAFSTRTVVTWAECAFFPKFCSLVYFFLQPGIPTKVPPLPDDTELKSS